MTLVYDAWNRMVAIKVGSTVKIAYAYDGLFRRIQETVGSTTHSQYYSASWQVIEERVREDVESDDDVGDGGIECCGPGVGSAGWISRRCRFRSRR